MLTDIGEYVVGAYLKLELQCDVVDYNVRPPGGGLAGLSELDVLGFDFTSDTAFLCEVTTHIRGLQYKGNKESVARIRKKHQRQKAYAKKYLQNFANIRYMFWSPVVPKGYLTEHLVQISGLELVINGQYKHCVEQLQARAREETQDARNPFFRMLQILGHLRDD